MAANVDVIVPCFNGARLLPQTLESVFAQTYSQVRLVVVDDGSTDDLASVVSKYQGRCELLRKPNGGQASARNLGIRETSGQYVCLLDADDLLRPTMLARLVARLEAQPETDAVYAKTLAFNGDDTRRLFAEHWRPFVPWTDLLSPLSMFCAIHGSATLLRRRAFERAGMLPEARDLQGCEDWHFWLQLRLSGAKVDFVPEVLTFYRIHSAASSAHEVGIAQRESALLQAASQLITGHLAADDRRRLILALGMRNVASRWLALHQRSAFDQLTGLATTVCAKVPEGESLRPLLTAADEGAPIALASALFQLQEPLLALVVLIKQCQRGHLVARARYAGLTAQLDELIEQAERFVVAAERAQGDQPSEPDFAGHVAHMIAATLLERGREGEALLWLQRALKLNPHQWPSRALEVQALFACGRYTDAAHHLANALDDGTAPMAKQLARHLYHAVEHHMGSASPALRALRGFTTGALGRYLR